MSSSTTFNNLLAALQRHVSSITAQGLLSVALRENGLTPATITFLQIPKLTPRLLRGVKYLLTAAERAALERELAGLSGAVAQDGGQTPIRAESVPVREERDIGDARSLARDLCRRLGGRPFVTQKVTTIVSELARNIVSYTAGGTIILIPSHQPSPRIVVRSMDEGPGIHNLDEVLAGRYRSRTGLGVGILGCKRLADRFEISTGAIGTQIEVEVVL